MKLDILAFAAHPDDVELAASGTVLAHIALGKKVGIIDLTRGELGTRGSAELRDEEAAASSKILGIHVRENLGLRDGFFVKDEATLLKVITMIRKYQPEIIICNSEFDRHIDHGRAGDLLHDACFLSGLRKVETTFNGVSQAAWRPKSTYHYIQDYMTKPDVIFDITPFYDKKIESIKSFKSQFFDPNSTEPETPISNKDFWPFIEARAREFGRLISVTYAEGFTVKRPIGSQDLTQLL
ncbi:MAG: bacillithiol biosynthesis deacetylase BshB1 [Bacteroidia bacterium]|nr:bacillithiol biosynthesis deacetylase BshB1 [Bacteroidia bacterium]MBP9689528.1 bacillithiol biosynthesis deacetylase BshB1 [Bacteroidia bacterium]